MDLLFSARMPTSGLQKIEVQALIAAFDADFAGLVFRIEEGTLEEVGGIIVDGRPVDARDLEVAGIEVDTVLIVFAVFITQAVEAGDDRF